MESKPIASSRSRLAGKSKEKDKVGRSQLLTIKSAVMPNTPLVRTQKKPRRTVHRYEYKECD